MIDKIVTPLNAIDLDLAGLTKQLAILNDTLLRLEAGAPYLLGVLACIAVGIWFRSK